MVEFYIERRADDANIDEDGDMLLFQWGTYDWGDGPSFEYDVTRQFTIQGEDDEDEIWQLSLTLHYPESEVASRAGAGDRWCCSPDEVDGFVLFVEHAPATAFARERLPERVELHFEPAD